jgi:hypothetical protein
MSFKGRLFEKGEQSAYGDDRGESAESLEGPEEKTGLLGRLERHVREWPDMYVEQRIRVRTGREK